MTFVARERLPYVRKRLGLPLRVSALRDKGLDRYFFDAASTFAVMRQSGKIEEFERDLFRMVRDEIAVLGASWLGLGRKRHQAMPAVADEQPKASRSYLLLHESGDTWIQPNMSVGAFERTTDEWWLRSAKQNFFYSLLPLLRGESSISSAWRRDLWNAAVMIGRSLAAKDEATALLFNMIALETLLTDRNDNTKEVLPRRAEALLGWAPSWSQRAEEWLPQLHEKRNRYVHQGVRHEIDAKDVIFTDYLLINVLTNLTAHPKLFDAKTALIDFTKRLEAKRLLGVNTRVRPRTLTQRWPSNLDKLAEAAF